MTMASPIDDDGVKNALESSQTTHEIHLPFWSSGSFHSALDTVISTNKTSSDLIEKTGELQNAENKALGGTKDHTSDVFSENMDSVETVQTNAFESGKSQQLTSLSDITVTCESDNISDIPKADLSIDDIFKNFNSLSAGTEAESMPKTSLIEPDIANETKDNTSLIFDAFSTATVKMESVATVTTPPSQQDFNLLDVFDSNRANLLTETSPESNSLFHQASSSSNETLLDIFGNGFIEESISSSNMVLNQNNINPTVDTSSLLLSGLTDIDWTTVNIAPLNGEDKDGCDETKQDISLGLLGSNRMFETQGTSVAVENLTETTTELNGDKNSDELFVVNNEDIITNTNIPVITNNMDTDKQQPMLLDGSTSPFELKLCHGHAEDILQNTETLAFDKQEEICLETDVQGKTTSFDYSIVDFQAKVLNKMDMPPNISEKADNGSTSAGLIISCDQGLNLTANEIATSSLELDLLEEGTESLLQDDNVIFNYTISSNTIAEEGGFQGIANPEHFGNAAGSNNVLLEDKSMKVHASIIASGSESNSLDDFVIISESDLATLPSSATSLERENKEHDDYIIPFNAKNLESKFVSNMQSGNHTSDMFASANPVNQAVMSPMCAEPSVNTINLVVNHQPTEREEKLQNGSICTEQTNLPLLTLVNTSNVMGIESVTATPKSATCDTTHAADKMDQISFEERDTFDLKHSQPMEGYANKTNDKGQEYSRSKQDLFTSYDTVVKVNKLFDTSSELVDGKVDSEYHSDGNVSNILEISSDKEENKMGSCAEKLCHETEVAENNDMNVKASNSTKEPNVNFTDLMNANMSEQMPGGIEEIVPDVSEEKPVPSKDFSTNSTSVDITEVVQDQNAQNSETTNIIHISTEELSKNSTNSTEAEKHIESESNCVTGLKVDHSAVSASVEIPMKPPRKKKNVQRNPDVPVDVEITKLEQSKAIAKDEEKSTFVEECHIECTLSVQNMDTENYVTCPEDILEATDPTATEDETQSALNCIAETTDEKQDSTNLPLAPPRRRQMTKQKLKTAASEEKHGSSAETDDGVSLVFSQSVIGKSSDEAEGDDLEYEDPMTGILSKTNHNECYLELEDHVIDFAMTSNMSGVSEEGVTMLPVDRVGHFRDNSFGHETDSVKLEQKLTAIDDSPTTDEAMLENDGKLGFENDFTLLHMFVDGNKQNTSISSPPFNDNLVSDTEISKDVKKETNNFMEKHEVDQVTEIETTDASVIHTETIVVESFANEESTTGSGKTNDNTFAKSAATSVLTPLTTQSGEGFRDNSYNGQPVREIVYNDNTADLLVTNDMFFQLGQDVSTKNKHDKPFVDTDEKSFIQVLECDTGQVGNGDFLDIFDKVPVTSGDKVVLPYENMEENLQENLTDWSASFISNVSLHTNTDTDQGTVAMQSSKTGFDVSSYKQIRAEDVLGDVFGIQQCDETNDIAKPSSDRKGNNVQKLMPKHLPEKSADGDLLDNNDKRKEKNTSNSIKEKGLGDIPAQQTSDKLDQLDDNFDPFKTNEIHDEGAGSDQSNHTTDSARKYDSKEDVFFLTPLENKNIILPCEDVNVLDNQETHAGPKDTLTKTNETDAAVLVAQENGHEMHFDDNFVETAVNTNDKIVEAFDADMAATAKTIDEIMRPGSFIHEQTDYNTNDASLVGITGTVSLEYISSNFAGLASDTRTELQSVSLTNSVPFNNSSLEEGFFNSMGDIVLEKDINIEQIQQTSTVPTIIIDVPLSHEPSVEQEESMKISENITPETIVESIVEPDKISTTIPADCADVDKCADLGNDDEQQSNPAISEKDSIDPLEYSDSSFDFPESPVGIFSGSPKQQHVESVGDNSSSIDMISESDDGSVFQSDHMIVSDVESQQTDDDATEPKVFDNISQVSLEFDDNPFSTEAPNPTVQTRKKLADSIIASIGRSKQKLSLITTATSIPSTVYLYDDEDDQVESKPTREELDENAMITKNLLPAFEVPLSNVLPFQGVNGEETFVTFEEDWEDIQQVNPKVDVLPMILELPEPGEDLDDSEDSADNDDNKEHEEKEYFNEDVAPGFSSIVQENRSRSLEYSIQNENSVTVAPLGQEKLLEEQTNNSVCSTVSEKTYPKSKATTEFEKCDLNSVLHVESPPLKTVGESTQDKCLYDQNETRIGNKTTEENSAEFYLPNNDFTPHDESVSTTDNVIQIPNEVNIDAQTNSARNSTQYCQLLDIQPDKSSVAFFSDNILQDTKQEPKEDKATFFPQILESNKEGKNENKESTMLASRLNELGGDLETPVLPSSNKSGDHQVIDSNNDELELHDHDVITTVPSKGCEPIKIDAEKFRDSSKHNFNDAEVKNHVCKGSHPVDTEFDVKASTSVESSDSSTSNEYDLDLDIDERLPHDNNSLVESGTSCDDQNLLTTVESDPDFNATYKENLKTSPTFDSKNVSIIELEVGNISKIEETHERYKADYKVTPIDIFSKPQQPDLLNAFVSHFEISHTIQVETSDMLKISDENGTHIASGLGLTEVHEAGYSQDANRQNNDGSAKLKQEDTLSLKDVENTFVDSVEILEEIHSETDKRDENIITSCQVPLSMGLDTTSSLRKESISRSPRKRYDTIGSIELLTDSEEEIENKDVFTKPKNVGVLISIGDDDDKEEALLSLPDPIEDKPVPKKRRSIAPPSSLVLSVALDEVNVQTPINDSRGDFNESVDQEQHAAECISLKAAEEVDSVAKEKHETRISEAELSSKLTKEFQNKISVSQLNPPPGFDEEIDWETIVIDNIEHKIDGHSIQPYKKAVSHGGFYKEKCTIVELFGSYLPDSSIRHYSWIMDNLFLYLLSTVELLVQSKEYVVVFFNNSVPKTRYPANAWLKKNHLLIPHTLRKNIKGFYIVQSSFSLKTQINFARMFLSRKVFKKIKNVKNHGELKQYIPIDFLFVPAEITRNMSQALKRQGNKVSRIWKWW
ncbi:uncharacterized protein LOC143449100 isoform X1 [Clavelina lepadiformis]|uniref:uncharacterized protein LOC143449100 isoform X1 n=1 Tax=Clavelina lepadiformis TaxID=159417 RepID=UPI004042FC13